MTIAISLKTPEGIVLGADSTTTCFVQPGQVGQLYNSAQKIFEIGPVWHRFVAGECFSGAIVTYDAGSLGPVSWRAAISNFYRERIRHNPRATDIAHQFLSFLQECWVGLQRSGQVAATEPIPNAGFLIACISQGCAEVEGARVQLQAATVEPQPVGNIHINGGFEVVSRLLYGYDVGLIGTMAGAGMDVAKFQALAQQFSAIPNVNWMPLRDAIDFVHFLVYSAIKLHRYRGGPASIGGPIEIAAITPDRGFRWIVHKRLSESIGIWHGGH